MAQRVCQLLRMMVALGMKMAAPQPEIPGIPAAIDFLQELRMY